MKSIFAIVILFCFSLHISSQIDSIYNDDPEQYLPLGVKIAEYKPFKSTGQKVMHERVEPPYWWTGMSNPSLELMIYAQNIKTYKVSISDKKGVQLIGVHRVQNPNYLFVEIEIDSATDTGFFDILLSSESDHKRISYELKSRSAQVQREAGLNSSDLIYLIMPDRFANGDYTNDSYEDMRQSGINRQKMYFRHGGDLQGIIDHLDYLVELGVTAIWLNPVLENDQPYASYHGYAVTDHYRIDKRFGTNELYRTLVRECHKKGIKVIMDIIFNHVGHEHWLMQDIPSEDWVHQWPEFTRSNFRSCALFDSHASKEDTEQLMNGWFDYSMPDLNQKNPRLSNYLIQNAIWWTEFSGLDAFRIDTWVYADQQFLSRWSKRMKEEFPYLGMFGEAWAQKLAVQASFAEHNHVTNLYDPHLTGITDFQLNYAIDDALSNSQSWTGGVANVYYTIAQDYLYDDPMKNVTFLDNHDRTRFFSKILEDEDKFRSGIAFLMTMRGIPSLYYGTELLFSGVSDPDGKVRQDFLGGWKEDAIDLFKASGRSERQNNAFEYVKKIAHYRKNTPALHSGRLMHFIPKEGVYVYFRYDEDKTIMMIMNTNDTSKSIATSRFNEKIHPFTKAKNIVSDEILLLADKIAVPENTTLILELMK